jgi:predicted MFS family arabinose efflux permease
MVLLVNLARVVFAPILEPVRAAFGASAAAVGLLATLAWLGSALPRLPTGYLLTRVPRHVVILGAGTTLALSPVLAATASSLPVLWGSAFLMGISSGMYFIAAKPLLSDLFPDGIGRALGVHGMSSQLAAAGAPVFVAAVLLIGDWRYVFFAISLAAALATVVFVVITRRMTVPAGENEDRDFLRAAKRQWPLIASGVVLSGFVGLAWNGVFNFYVSYLVSAKAVSASTARLLLAVVFTAGIPAFALAGSLADRLPHIPLVLGIIGSFAGCMLALTATTGVYALAVVSVALGFAFYGLLPAMDTYMLDSLPDAHRASAYAVFSATIIFINALGSVVVGVLLDAGYTFTAIFQFFAAVIVVSVAVLTTYQLTRGFPTGRLPDRSEA